jgi:hypothetical protein
MDLKQNAVTVGRMNFWTEIQPVKGHQTIVMVIQVILFRYCAIPLMTLAGFGWLAVQHGRNLIGEQKKDKSNGIQLTQNRITIKGALKCLRLD